MTRPVQFLAIVLACAAAQPALAQQKFENLDRIDSLVAMTVGANMGEPGGPLAPVDRRLRLAACPTTLSVEGPIFGAAMVKCDALGWRIRVPLVAGAANSPAMRAAAAADFGNGLSWVLPAERFNFANADLSLQLARQPVGEWVGLDAVTTIAPDGSGCAFSQLHDERGRFGFATQTLLVFAR